MFFRSSRVYLAQVFPGCQSSGVCVADVQFAAVVLATNPTAGIQSAHHGSSLGAAAADDERDPDLLSGLCGPVSSTRISRVVADAEGRGAPKNPGQDATTSSRSIASARPRSGSLDSLRIQKCALENLSRPRQGYTFLLPCKSFALVTRDIRAASRSEEHTSELQSRRDLGCRLLLEKKKKVFWWQLLIKRTCTRDNFYII